MDMASLIVSLTEKFCDKRSGSNDAFRVSTLIIA